MHAIATRLSGGPPPFNVERLRGPNGRVLEQPRICAGAVAPLLDIGEAGVAQRCLEELDIPQRPVTPTLGDGPQRGAAQGPGVEALALELALLVEHALLQVGDAQAQHRSGLEGPADLAEQRDGLVRVQLLEGVLAKDAIPMGLGTGQRMAQVDHPEAPRRLAPLRS